VNARTIFPLKRVTIVGALNLTPDSFSDGGRFVRTGSKVNIEAAVEAAESLVRDGAHVIDIGGESTRPGAVAVGVEVEIDRTAPVIEAIAKRVNAPISIDTRKAAVAEAALDAGARIVNDVSGLTFDSDLAGVVAAAQAVLILGHARGTPETMQREPFYDDAVAEVGDELAAAVSEACAAGVATDRIAVDPGIGFAKRVEDNLRLISNLGALALRLSHQVLVGPSRKAFLGAVTGDPVERRDPATWAACAIAAFVGADAVRVHDVAGAVKAVAVGRAMRDASQEAAV
jgi:dihydropteroate synthase